MKFKVTTTYENIDQEWLDWYLDRLAKNDVLPGSKSIASALRKMGAAQFSTDDPSSDAKATTVYEIIRR